MNDCAASIQTNCAEHRSGGRASARGCAPRGGAEQGAFAVQITAYAAVAMLMEC